MLKYILLGILALLLLLLFAPVKAEAVWRQEVLSLRLRLLWLFPVRILPAKKDGEQKAKKKPRKAKKEKEKKPRKKPPAAPQSPAEKLLDLLQLINDLLSALTAGAGYILRRVTLSRCRIALVISREEADETGIACGRAYAAAYSLQSGLRGVIRVKEFFFNVLPDFISGRDAADAEVTLEVRPSTLLAGGILLLAKGIGAIVARKKTETTEKAV